MESNVIRFEAASFDRQRHSGKKAEPEAVARLTRALVQARLGPDDIEAFARAVDALGADEVLREVQRALDGAGGLGAGGADDAFRPSRPAVSLLLEPTLLMPHVRVRSWRRLVVAFAERAARAWPWARGRSLRRLLSRDPASSGWLLGGGLAVPHVVVDDCPHPRLGVITVPQGLGVTAPDRHPVRLVFVAVEPPDVGERHLWLLARVARWCASASNIGLLMAARTPEALHNAIEVLDQDV